VTSNHYLAFDFGAESGRAIIGTLENQKISLKEIHRFPTGMLPVHNHYKWNVYRLYEEILHGIQICVKNEKIQPSSIGIDTWGVDYGLFDREGNLMDIPFCYRDSRTDGAMEEFFKRIPRERVYELTGIQFMQLNTIYQLYSQVRDQSEQPGRAKTLLFMPDIFNYLLTGKQQTEFTFATTSQLFNPVLNDWDPEIFEALGIPLSIMQKIVQPGSKVGELQKAVALKTGAGKIPVVAVASHDTGSAIAAIPAEGSNWAYISSGTWSLMGIESKMPLISPRTLEFNLTNEGGVEHTFRVLKNIMGLWLLQQCKVSWAAKDFTYPQLVELAGKAKPFAAILDPDAAEFLNPSDMPEAIRNFCSKTGQAVPADEGSMVRIILESLALKYALTLRQLKEISPVPLEKIYIIGGGVNNSMLCQYTANACDMPVVTGPAEGTALGNILVQAMAMGQLSSLQEIRQVVKNSFSSVVYQPENTAEWKDALYKYEQISMKIQH
jgi:rhamnulokinase